MMMTMQTTCGCHALRRFCIAGALTFGWLAGTSLWAADNDLTDQKICHVVEDALYSDSAVPFNRLDATCADGVITLKGQVSNMLARQRAVRRAETVKGVRRVIDQITIEHPSDRSATQVRTDVESALITDPATDSYELNVSADDQGKVTLTGTVESWQERQLAETVTASVKGVTDITNNIKVDYKTQRPQYEIKPEIEQTLEWDSLVDHRNITVAVDGGKVTLSGTVGSAAELRRAREAAWVAGVSSVDATALQVQDWKQFPKRSPYHRATVTEADIRDAINDKNLTDPRVKSFNVTPMVHGSVVTLRGKVDNLKAKQAAVRNARNTSGVSHVEDRLKVRPATQRSDNDIMADIGLALLRDPYVERYDVSVSVIDGIAFLHGTVNSYFEKAQAEDAASRVNGVTKVRNGLVVANEHMPVMYSPFVDDWSIYDHSWYGYTPAFPAKTDQQIKTDVEDQLWWSPFVDSDEVNVSVENGVATLTGTVDSYQELRSATENALEGGATTVDNNLTIGS